jgi:hypothetical protein
MSAGKPQYILQLGLKTYQGGMCLSEEAIPKSVFSISGRTKAGCRGEELSWGHRLDAPADLGAARVDGRVIGNLDSR